MIATRRIYQEVKDRYNTLLALSDTDLHAYWETHIAINYWGGSYLDRATDRSKKMMFNRWKKYIKKYVDSPLGEPEPSF